MTKTLLTTGPAAHVPSSASPAGMMQKGRALRGSFMLAALLTITPLGAPAVALAATRAEQQVQNINQGLSRQLQVQQQNQSFQWQLDNQRMRQQIDTPFSGTGSATCPAGSVGC
jgi:predicted PurR-regulated permease PerM